VSDGGLPWRRGVGVMLANPAGRVFVGERLDAPGAWQMPQGGIDAGETPRQAALRELEEETGVSPGLVTVEAETAGWVRYELPAELVGKVWKGRYRGQEQKWFLLRFAGRDDQVRLDLDHAEFARWRWADPAELVDGIVPFKRDLYVQVLAQFAPLLARA
jgi:putative (di)nucleoside polyphosphate hydrolase